MKVSVYGEGSVLHSPVQTSQRVMPGQSDRRPDPISRAYSDRKRSRPAAVKPPIKDDEPPAPDDQSSEMSFTSLLLVELPRMRGHALFLTRTTADAEDLLQQTALRALKAQHQFTMGTNIRAWLYRIMRNEFIDNYRQSKGNVSFGEMPEDLLVGKASQEDGIETREVVSAMKKLKPLLLEVMLLIPGRGLSYQEAADIQGCSVGTIKSRLSRARAKLQSFLVDGNDID